MDLAQIDPKRPVYQVMAKGIRVQRPGREHLEVKRPYNARREVFLDSDEAPTLIQFEEGEHVDLDGLLRTGAIVPYTLPPAQKAAATRAQAQSKG